MPGGWGKGSTRAWRRVRASVLKRDGWRCQVQLPGTCTGVADCVHHVVGRAVSGDDPRYLVASCTPCNLAIGQPGRRRGRRAQAPRRDQYNRW